MKNYILSIDVGGTHITAAVVDMDKKEIISSSTYKEEFNSNEDKDAVLDYWQNAINNSLEKSGVKKLTGIGISMPGPFNYTEGVCWIKDQDKYKNFYGVNIRQEVITKLSLPEDFPVLFENDAICFSKGEVLRNFDGKYGRVLSITLGTGLGACFIENNKVITDDKRIPEDGTLYNVPYRHGIAEEYISTRALILRYYHLTGNKVDNGKQLFNLAVEGNEPAKQAFADMGQAMANVLLPWIQSFEPECLIIGGKIGNASEFFLPAFNQKIVEQDISIDIHISSDNEASALVGAAGLLVEEMGVLKNFKEV